MRMVWLALAVAALSLPVRGETRSAAGPVFQIDFSNPAISPSHWTLTLHPDGSGHFRSERGNGPAVGQQTIDAPDVDRDIRLSAEFAGRVFETARQHKLFAVECESHLKVAFQGRKKLSYAGPASSTTRRRRRFRRWGNLWWRWPERFWKAHGWRCCCNMTAWAWTGRWNTWWRPRAKGTCSRFALSGAFWSGWRKTPPCWSA